MLTDYGANLGDKYQSDSTKGEGGKDSGDDNDTSGSSTNSKGGKEMGDDEGVTVYPVTVNRDGWVYHKFRPKRHHFRNSRAESAMVWPVRSEPDRLIQGD